MTSNAKRNISLSSAILFLNFEETWYRGLRPKMYSARAYVLMLMLLVFSPAYAFVLVRTSFNKIAFERKEVNPDKFEQI